MPARVKSTSVTIQKSVTTQPTPITGEVVIYAKTDGKMYSKDETGTETALGGGATSTYKYARLSSTKTAGTAGDVFSTGAWTTYPLSTEDADPDSIVSVASNQFTLANAGTYRISIVCGVMTPVGASLGIRLRLRNITDSTTEFQSAQALLNVTLASTRGGGVVVLQGVVTITASKTFATQYWASSAGQTGYQLSTGDSEVYSTVLIEKMA